MAKEPNSKPADATPPMPAGPLLPPVPSMLAPAVSSPAVRSKKREIIDAFKPASREDREARQTAKQVLDECANLLSQMHHTQARLQAIVTRGADPQIATLFAREGLTVEAARQLNKALITVLDEFMPVKSA